MKCNKRLPAILIAIFINIFLLNFQTAFSQTNERAVLWEISGNGLKKSSYLFGTVHIIDSSKFFLDKTVIEKINSCKKMIFEINTNDPDYQKKALRYSFMSNDSLDNIFSEREYKKLELFLKNEFNFPLSAVKKMKPFYLSAVINALSMPKNAKSYEAELMEFAKANGLEISGISTLEKENEIIEKMDMEVQIYSLYDAIEEYKNGYKRREQIVYLYRNKDIHAIYELMKREESPEDSIIYDIMFPQRHRVWVPSIIELMNKQSCFFAVGVGHLPGKEGLINLLIKEGYKVEPVKVDFELRN